MSMVWENGPKAQAERFVLLALADYANDEGECWPSIAGICRKTCMSERGVQGVIRRLQSSGWLSVSIGSGRRNCNVYTIKNPAPPAPRTTCPPHMDAETPHMDAINPAPPAPEPSLTIKEPSLSSSSRDAGTNDFDLLSEVLSAVGLKGGRIPAHWMPPAASLHVNRWVSDLGLTNSEIISAAHESRKRFSDPPNGPKALDRVMQNLAGTKQAPALSPAIPAGAKYDRSQSDRAINELANQLSDGTVSIDYSNRDPFAIRPRGGA